MKHSLFKVSIAMVIPIVVLLVVFVGIALAAQVFMTQTWTAGAEEPTSTINGKNTPSWGYPNVAIPGAKEASGYGVYRMMADFWNPDTAITGTTYQTVTLEITLEETTGEFWVTKSPNSYFVNGRVSGTCHISDTGCHWTPDNRHAPTSYPSIYKGCHWGQCSEDKNGIMGAPFPIQASEIINLPSQWTIDKSAVLTSAVYDAAYDIWMDKNTSGNLPNKPEKVNQNDGVEIMIWMDYQGYNSATNMETPIRPAGKLIINGLTIPGISGSWDVWLAPNAGDDIHWNIVSYVREEPTTSMSFDAKLFLDHAMSISDKDCGGYCVSPSWWLTSVQAGFEIWADGAGLHSKSFSVEPTFVPRVYVNQNANGSNNGTSWKNAYKNLQDALANVSSGQIWVAKGVYYPGNSREATFQLKNDVAIYGGFAGNENSLDQRNLATNITVLSGDLDQDDATDANKVINTPADIKGNNAYHVVSGSGVNLTARLDGFTITGGNANGSVENQQQGGGMRNDNGSPTLANVIFSGNRATWGGGLANLNGSLPKITNATFSGNQAIDGGGVYNNDSGPVIDNAVFSGNKVTGNGGAMMSYECGGDYDPDRETYINYPTVRNSTFAGNYTWDYVHYSGAIHNYRSIASYSNCIMWGNNQPERSIYNVQSMVGVGYSDFEGCQGHNDGGVPFDCDIYDEHHKNKKVDPMFVAPISASFAPTTTGNYRLQEKSPVIDAGNNFSVTVRLDRDNRSRIVDGKSVGVASVDLGAYEYSYSSEINIYLPLILRVEE